ncbi:hypothetical protein AB1N83_011873 [Pleurotus pulmonarius]
MDTSELLGGLPHGVHSARFRENQLEGTTSDKGRWSWTSRANCLTGPDIQSASAYVPPPTSLIANASRAWAEGVLPSCKLPYRTIDVTKQLSRLNFASSKDAHGFFAVLHVVYKRLAFCHPQQPPLQPPLHRLPTRSPPPAPLPSSASASEIHVPL